MPTYPSSNRSLIPQPPQLSSDSPSQPTFSTSPPSPQTVQALHNTHQHSTPDFNFMTPLQPHQQPPPHNPRKRRATGHITARPSFIDPHGLNTAMQHGGLAISDTNLGGGNGRIGFSLGGPNMELSSPTQPFKRGRTNTPWSPAEEQRLKVMRDEGKSWSEIAKAFPTRTEGSVKKHWYKDMHYAEFEEDDKAALLAAIKEYDSNKWKIIGAKVGKPAKACEQYAKEHLGGKI